MGSKLIIGGITFLGTLDAVYNIGKKLKIIPSKEAIEETVERKKEIHQESTIQVSQHITKEKESSGMTWNEFLWGQQKPSTNKKELVKEIISPENTNIPSSGKEIIVNGLDSITSTFNDVYCNILNALLPYWGYVEVIIAFHLTLLLIVFIAIDIMIILKVLLLLKQIVRLILQLFGKE